LVAGVACLEMNEMKTPDNSRVWCKVLTESRQAGTIETDAFGATSVPGLYVIGDASSAGMQSVPGAVSDGSMVGVAVQRALVKEDVERV